MKKLKTVLLVSVMCGCITAVVTVLAQREPQRPNVPPSASSNKKTAGFTNSIGMEFVQIPAGTFMMGSDPSSCPRDDPFTGRNEYQDCADGMVSHEKPRHQVTISQSFWLGKYEVTQAEWYKVMGNNPSHIKSERVGDNARNHPVENISWHDAHAFIQRLNQSESTNKYRLPSEAEWEYACREGATGDSIDAIAWHNYNSFLNTHPVGQKQPNRFGLYDMQGNVYEWCEDVWHNNYQGAPTDGSSWLSGGDLRYRIARGGNYLNPVENARSAHRGKFAPGGREHVVIGLRVVLSAKTP